jgi:hypothetical protein
MRALTVEELGFVSGGTASTPPPRETEVVIVTGSSLGGYFSGFHMPSYGITNVGVGDGGFTNIDFDFDIDEFFRRLGSMQTAGQAALVLGSLPGNTVTSTIDSQNTTTHTVTYGRNGDTLTVTDRGSNGSFEGLRWTTGSITYNYVPGSGFQPVPRGM